MWRAVERWGSQIKSGLNFDFLSRLFGRQKTYTQFESTEDIFADAKEELASDEEDDVILMRDSDPYEVTYERRKTKVTGYGTCSEYDVVQIHTHSERANGSLKTGTELDHCDGAVHSDSTRNASSGHHRQGSTVREDVGDFVSSVFQKQYTKLENDAADDAADGAADDSHTSCDRDHSDGGKCDCVKRDDSNVFHSIKDVNPNYKVKKPKRRKKVAKRTRRMIRGTWKWLRRGMSEYAKAFNAPTFFVINVSGGAVNKTNLR